MAERKPIVIGLVGEAGTGKGEVARLLVEQGFEPYSLSDTLREICRALDLVPDRQHLILLGNTLREHLNGNVLAQGAKRWVDQSQATHVVIESIRNPEEVTFLRQELGAYILGVTMPPEKTFELMKKRGRSGDPQTMQEYLKLKAIEQGLGEKSSGQQIARCVKLADSTIDNSSTLDDLRQTALKLLSSLQLLPGQNLRELKV